MHIDKPGDDIPARGIDDGRGINARKIADLEDPIAPDTDVGTKPGVARAVDDPAATDDDVVVGLLGTSHPGAGHGNDAGENNASLVFPPRVALLLRATFFYHRPNSHFITGRTRQFSNLRPASTGVDMVECPDLDNMVKFIMDRPLEGVVYGDDRTIVKMEIEKLWDDKDECTGRTYITVDLRHRV